jgi:hypothetical protein
MTPKEKADELIRKYYTWGINKEGKTLSWLESKQCALIVVDEILDLFLEESRHTRYWKDVIKEIKKLKN